MDKLYFVMQRDWIPVPLFRGPSLQKVSKCLTSSSVRRAEMNGERGGWVSPPFRKRRDTVGRLNPTLLSENKIQRDLDRHPEDSKT